MAEDQKRKYQFRSPWEPRTCTVDLTEWIDMDPPCVVTLTEPDVRETYIAGRDIEPFSERNPDWPDNMCAEVAGLAVTCSGPDGIDPPGLFIEDLARNCPPAFEVIRKAFNKSFSSVQNLGDATEKAKNG